MVTELSQENCQQVLRTNYIGYLGYVDNGLPFVVPITYYYDREKGVLLSYSGVGHKVNSLRRFPNCTVYVENVSSLTNWRSIQIQGKFEEVIGSDFKHGLRLFSDGVKSVMESNGEEMPQYLNEFSGATASETVPILYKIEIQKIIGKEGR